MDDLFFSALHEGKQEKNAKIFLDGDEMQK
jgi:hypothetical protein